MLRTLVVGVLTYVTLVIFLRISGKRALSKMNAYDLVVTVALGSTLASALVTKDVALADGALAFALLIGLQFIWGRSRQSCWRRMARSAWSARVRELAARAWKGLRGRRGAARTPNQTLQQAAENDCPDRCDPPGARRTRRTNVGFLSHKDTNMDDRNTMPSMTWGRFAAM